MDYSLRQKLEKAARNKYEAVIVASRLARRINSIRAAEEEQAGPDGPGPTHPGRVTTEALEELAQGNIKYHYKDEQPTEEEYFPET